MSSPKKDPFAPGAGGLVESEGESILPEEKTVTNKRQELKCDKCGSTEIRIGHNQFGIRAYCTSCKHQWGIAATTGSPRVPTYAGRGMSKETLVEPEWGLAYEDDVDTVGQFDDEDYYP